MQLELELFTTDTPYKVNENGVFINPDVVPITDYPKHIKASVKLGMDSKGMWHYGIDLTDKKKQSGAFTPSSLSGDMYSTRLEALASGIERINQLQRKRNR